MQYTRLLLQPTPVIFGNAKAIVAGELIGITTSRWTILRFVQRIKAIGVPIANKSLRNAPAKDERIFISVLVNANDWKMCDFGAKENISIFRRK